MVDLVIGGAGFIGSNLTRALAAQGGEVVVADNLCATGSTALIDGLGARVRFVHVDIRCPEDFARLPLGPYRRIFHLAASFANELSERHPELDARTNHIGTRHVVAFAERAGCELLVYAGSSSSYGDAPLPMREEGPLRPQTPYARNKLLGEQEVRAARVPWAIFRLFNVYGPGDLPGPFRNAIPNMFAAVDRGEPLRLLGEGATRDFNYIDDLLPVLLAPEPAVGRVLNLGSGVETPIPALIAALLSAVERPEHPVRHLPPRPWDRVPRRVADVAALHALFGPLPRTPLTTGLSATLAWLRRAGTLRGALRADAQPKRRAL